MLFAFCVLSLSGVRAEFVRLDVIRAAPKIHTLFGTIGPPNANRLSVGLQYPRRTVANYEGGSWYLRASYDW